MNKPYFSLITPVYNIERLIQATINSAITQTFTDWEMICVDDGSPDNAGKICDDFAAKDERIRVIHKKNEGLPAARNTGLKEAKGDYFIILEGSDLFFDENTLQVIHDLIGGREIDIFFGRLQDKMEHTGEITGVQDKYCVDGLWDKGGQSLVCRLYDNDDILALSSPVNKAFRREFVTGNNLWFCEGIYHDDDEWLPKAIAHSKLSLFSEQIIYNAMTWDGCFGGIKNEKGLCKKAVDKMFLAKRCCEYFDEHFHDDNELLSRMYNYYIHFYEGGVTTLNELTEAEYIIKVKRAAAEYSGILKYSSRTNSKNLKMLNIIRKTLGAGAVTKMLCQRYK